ncbi:DNA polymerase III subunit chi, partial [Klebsiella pneumoniae]|uniref:DNA polymerase III subunit chi n=1 Tax=Klebsiella pneumoniae TaxID=573 RepID=UPI001D0D9076
MKNATFYLLDNDATVDGLSAVEQLVCDIAAERWRNGKRVLIACEDEQQAIRTRLPLRQRSAAMSHTSCSTALRPSSSWC